MKIFFNNKLKVKSMNLKKLTIFSLLAFSFVLTGCQNQVNSSKDGNTAKNSVDTKFNFFSFNKGSVSSGGDEGKEIGSIDEFLKLDLGTKLDNVKLGEDISIPIIIQGEYYVYKEPDSGASAAFVAGTSISGHTATITVAKGGSTDLTLENFKDRFTVDLANLIDTGNTWKVLPTPIVEEIGSLKSSSKDSLLNRKLVLYFCYPVYNEVEFSIKVPAKNDLNPKRGDEVIDNIKANDGEIKFNLDANGFGTTKGNFIVQLKITPELRNVEVGNDGNLMLAHDKMTTCGSPIDPYRKYKYPVYIKLEGENNIDIDCSSKNNIYDMRANKYGIVCKLKIPMEDVEKIINMKLKVAYTLVKKEEVDNIGTILDYNN
jgi:hypothetical protein